jgi:hypothetical protein
MISSVTDHDRDQAFADIRVDANRYGVHVAEHDWRDIGS